eukprot:m.808919 g.808919  ORF g.808919 m.808919 type:complete len:147 (+) comp59316_c1_seq24:57-497(+)
MCSHPGAQPPPLCRKPRVPKCFQFFENQETAEDNMFASPTLAELRQSLLAHFNLLVNQFLATRAKPSTHHLAKAALGMLREMKEQAAAQAAGSAQSVFDVPGLHLIESDEIMLHAGYEVGAFGPYLNVSFRPTKADSQKPRTWVAA